ncbi:hypothetical protein [Altererythrobacter ishigakiensis]|uniref:Uncharacterized protein n=1 Tax=Altererythrobacter ishigakiensis TaxID=476157 RepID=A0A562UVG0_9SPHN|nr:hypothetical protein [Altererythrobacter ishigakiensis]TWJ09577.1 hypothetical protein JN10_1214 [Altererythrobacter ishigakiensis]
MSLAIPLALMAVAGTTESRADKGELPEGFSGAALMYHRALFPACPALAFEDDYLIQVLRQNQHELDDWVAGTAMADELLEARKQAASERALAKDTCPGRTAERDARAHQADILQLDEAMGLLDRLIVDAKDNIHYEREED